MSKSFVNKLFEYGKDVVIINLQTKNDATEFSSFKDTDLLHIKLGLGVKVNGKNLFEQLKEKIFSDSLTLILKEQSFCRISFGY